MNRSTTVLLWSIVATSFLLSAGALAQSAKTGSKTGFESFGDVRSDAPGRVRVSRPITTVGGSLSASDPLYTAPRLAANFSPTCDATSGNLDSNHRYDVYRFQVTSPVDFVAALDSPDFDTVMSLYCSFEPLSPLANLIALDDDDGAALNSAFIAADDIALVPGVDYFLVVSSFAPNDTGSYTLTLTSDVTLGAPTTSDCTVGPELGATILYPYFETDLEDAGGINTLLSANNWGPDPTINRVTVWNDWGKPTLAFDVYLEPNDVQSFSVRDLLNGAIPSTGEDADLSGFPGCTAQPPNSYPAGGAFPTGQIAQIKAYHTGVAGPLDNNCSGQAFGDGIARGYITIDNVVSCSGPEGLDPEATAANPAYQSTVLGFQNVLGGDLIVVEPDDASAQGYDAVHLTADARNRDFITFYGQYNGNTGIDLRNPLPTGSNLRYLNGGPFDGGADVLQWLSNLDSDTSSVPCGTKPSWYPTRIDVTAFDEDAGSQVTFGNTNRFPAVTQRVPITAFSNISTFGMLRLDNDVQSWSYVILKAGGIFSGGWSGVPKPGDALCGVAAP